MYYKFFFSFLLFSSALSLLVSCCQSSTTTVSLLIVQKWMHVDDKKLNSGGMSSRLPELLQLKYRDALSSLLVGVRKSLSS